MSKLLAVALVSALWLLGETEPKNKAADYPAHGTAGNISVGADYLVHSIPAGNQTFLARDYLVVEVAVFPGKDAPVEIGGNTFALRISGKKLVLTPDSPYSAGAATRAKPPIITPFTT